MKRQNINVVPTPHLVSVNEGILGLPEQTLVHYKGGEEARRLAEQFVESLSLQWTISECASCPADCAITIAGPGDRVPDKEDTRLHDLGPQGYILDIGDSIRLLANSASGIRYGLYTLQKIIADTGITMLPKCRIEDSPAVDLRMVMLDLARLKEKHEYYYRVIDFLAGLKVNAVFLHLNDSEGCAIELKKRPELVSPYAFSHEEMKDLILYAEDRGVELIPEIESFGHAGFILFLDKYKHLAEGDSGGAAKCLCTLKDETWQILEDIYGEVTPLFPTKYVHAGCDEADFGHCPDCQAEIERIGKDGLLNKHLQKVYELAKRHGKTPMIWGDILLQHRSVADELPKDTVICHWDYRAALSDEPVFFLQEKGFRVIGCPALVMGSRTVLPHADTLENIVNFAKIVREQNCMGFANTVWIPQRYIADTLWYGLALGAELVWSGDAHERSVFDRAFISGFFGPDAADELAIAVPALHEINRGAARFYQSFWNSREEYEVLLQVELVMQAKLQKTGVETCLKLLRKVAPIVTRHKEEFDALLLAAEVLLHMDRRVLIPSYIDHMIKEARLRAGSGRKGDVVEKLDAARLYLEEILADEEMLADRISEAWDRWRYPDDPKKLSEKGENIFFYFTKKRDFLYSVITKLTEMAAALESDAEIEWDNPAWYT